MCVCVGVCAGVRIVLKRWRNKKRAYNRDRLISKNNYRKTSVLIPNFAFIISHMNICCCCSLKVNKLVDSKNKPRDLLPNVNKGKQVC